MDLNRREGRWGVLPALSCVRKESIHLKILLDKWEKLCYDYIIVKR